ncbi:MAG: thioredoxin [Bacteroidales bacterium]|jgi:thioredoxin 1|nr:thioredoxin [Bacteroidales bacterium]
MAVAITESNFEELVLKSDKPVLVDFWAEWCGPCRMIAPLVEQLATEYEGKALIGKVDVEQSGEIARQYGILSIPTLLYFKKGELVDKQVGSTSKDVLAAKLNALL